ncbi:uncharacterized protein sS8_0155 [Methylocaldum marinum]|uniref:Uncharacterized protein n=1 Tax=Methylocaldum marinum TaxID=1432792 RepID=A0A286P3A1_9GAMM|nr:hypothetical protein [Methylocaldum marinum]BBA32123.1 uncharacterized protein sS8_0155 [Methylocaldum marinum]
MDNNAGFDFAFYFHVILRNVHHLQDSGNGFIAGQRGSAAEGIAAVESLSTGFDFAFYFHVFSETLISRIELPGTEFRHRGKA